MLVVNGISPQFPNSLGVITKDFSFIIVLLVYSLNQYFTKNCKILLKYCFEC